MSTEAIDTSHVASVLSVCRRGDYEFLNKIIAAGGNFDAIKDKNGRTALHYCVEVETSGQSALSRRNSCIEQFSGGRLKCAEALVKAYPSLMSVFDIDGMAAIHHGVAHNNLNLIKILIDNGTPIDLPMSEPSSGMDNSYIIKGRTVVHLAVMYGKADILLNLLNGSLGVKAKVDIKDSQNATPLHYAVQLQGDTGLEIIKILVNVGKCDFNVTDAHERTPVSWAATIGNHKSVIALLQLGADPKVSDESGLTPLHCASSRGHWETVDALIDFTRGDEFAIDKCDFDGCTPLFYATTMGHLSITKSLLEAGADASKKDKKNRSLCHCATRPVNQKVISEQIRLLTMHGADPWSASEDGETPLHDACQMGNSEYVMELAMLPEFKDHINDLNKNGSSLILTTVHSLKDPLMHKYHDHLVEILKLLASRGADVNTVESDQNEEKKTLIDILMEKEVYFLDAINILREKGGKTYKDLIQPSETETPVKPLSIDCNDSDIVGKIIESNIVTESEEQGTSVKIDDLGHDNTTLPTMTTTGSGVHRVDEPISNADTIDPNASPVKSIIIERTLEESIQEQPSLDLEVKELSGDDKRLSEQEISPIFMKNNNILDDNYDMFADDKTEVSMVSSRNEENSISRNVLLEQDDQLDTNSDEDTGCFKPEVKEINEESNLITEVLTHHLSSENQEAPNMTELHEEDDSNQLVKEYDLNQPVKEDDSNQPVKEEYFNQPVNEDDSHNSSVILSAPIIIPSVTTVSNDIEEKKERDYSIKSSSRNSISKESVQEPEYADEFASISSDSEQKTSIIRNEIKEDCVDEETMPISVDEECSKDIPRFSAQDLDDVVTQLSVHEKETTNKVSATNNQTKVCKTRPKTSKPTMAKPQKIIKQHTLPPFSKTPTLSETISELTGRKKIPKPTLSPYLTPLIPPRYTLRTHSASMNGNSRGPSIIELVQYPTKPRKALNKKSHYGLALQPGNSNAKPPILRGHLPPRGIDKEREQILALHQAAISRSIANKVQLSVSDFEFIRIAAKVANQYNHMLLQQKARDVQNAKMRCASSSPKKHSSIPRSMRAFQDMLESEDTMMKSIKKRSKSCTKSDTTNTNLKSKKIKIPTYCENTNHDVDVEQNHFQNKSSKSKIKKSASSQMNNTPPAIFQSKSKKGRSLSPNRKAVRI